MPVVELEMAERWVGKTEKDLRKAMVKGLFSAALAGVQEIVVSIISSRSPQPIDRGIYRAGWRAVPSPDGADIENLEPVAVFIEEGVRAENVKPGQAMLDALTEWVQRKGLANGPEAASAAYAIAMNMQKKGIFGKQGMGILRELVNGQLTKLIEREVAREIDRL